MIRYIFYTILTIGTLHLTRLRSMRRLLLVQNDLCYATVLYSISYWTWLIKVPRCKVMNITIVSVDKGQDIYVTMHVLGPTTM